MRWIDFQEGTSGSIAIYDKPASVGLVRWSSTMTAAGCGSRPAASPPSCRKTPSTLTINLSTQRRASCAKYYIITMRRDPNTVGSPWLVKFSSVPNASTDLSLSSSQGLVERHCKEAAFGVAGFLAHGVGPGAERLAIACSSTGSCPKSGNRVGQRSAATSCCPIICGSLGVPRPAGARWGIRQPVANCADCGPTTRLTPWTELLDKRADYAAKAGLLLKSQNM